MSSLIWPAATNRLNGRPWPSHTACGYVFMPLFARSIRWQRPLIHAHAGRRAECLQFGCGHCPAVDCGQSMGRDLPVFSSPRQLANPILLRKGHLSRSITCPRACGGSQTHHRAPYNPKRSLKSPLDFRSMLHAARLKSMRPSLVERKTSSTKAGPFQVDFDIWICGAVRISLKSVQLACLCSGWAVCAQKRGLGDRWFQRFIRPDCRCVRGNAWACWVAALIRHIRVTY
ncbi:hypothetical protein IMCC21224_111212 [Puniceibacterium sp. IMCC21224]|nr:hypothetical protein IMCC21224_111212 [Puniceibacterium sp. IMCC21224]